ncbi:MAG: hypothetical protein LEGION0403_FIIPPAGN_02503 [Legionella sp.]
MGIIVKLFDIDGCAYHLYNRGGYKDQPHEQWLLQSNQSLLQQI